MTSLSTQALLETGTCVLDVERSVNGKRWILTESNERLAAMLSQQHVIPDIVARLMAARGIQSNEVEGFLNPTLKDLMPDPLQFKDMAAATKRIITAIKEQQTITVFGDYDVDGATSSALLIRFFRAIGTDIEVYIPDRVEEGYGPSAQAFQTLKNQGTDLIITVDCGVMAFDALAVAADIGLDVIVLDHHEAEPELPKAVAIVNPNRIDEDRNYGYLAAVGVTFMTVVALNRALREEGYYQDRPEPDLIRFLDLVALGTVCDVVPLVGLNRALVIQGLKVMARRQNIGLAALCDVCKMSETPTPFHLGFILGPRVNAGGRVGCARAGTKLLSTEDPIEARDLAEQLNEWNKERKNIESSVQRQAEKMALEQSGAVTIVAGTDWHPGVIGIVASRLKEKFDRPACVIALADGIGKGSGRSVAGVDLGAAIIAAKQNNLLVNGGGHEMAAGFTLEENQLEAFTAFLNQRIAQQLNGQTLLPTLKIDGLLSPSGLTIDLAKTLEKMEPFGAGNPQPRFALTGAKVSGVDIVGERHIKCFIGDSAGGGGVKGICFGAVGTALGDSLMSAGGAPLNLAGQIRINRWNGYEKVEFQVEDASKIW